jgi:hypothetical protein
MGPRLPARGGTLDGLEAVGQRWQRELKEFDYVRNTYRVLLTRARYETVVWVPRGSCRGEPWYDSTRDAAEMDAVAEFLLACGARPLGEEVFGDAVRRPSPALL